MTKQVHPAKLVAIDDLRTEIASDGGLFVCCAGYEERALYVARTLGRENIACLRVVRLVNGDAANDAAFKDAQEIFSGIGGEETVEYDLTRITAAASSLRQAFADLVLPGDERVYVDISGFPGHGICQVLFALREKFKSNSVVCVYTAAAEYYPQEEEYRQCLDKSGAFRAEALPDSLTYEAADNLILPVFQGFSVRQEKTCLFLLAGFEKHRSVTVVESINPTRLVLIYGTPPRPDLQWREELSRKLHADLFANVIRAEEAVITLDVPALYQLFELYYSMLYDDMSIVVCPINSKLQTVASYLFWEQYRDVQLCFPLPVRYLPSRSSVGHSDVFRFNMPPVPQVAALLGL
jgi:hypothetical protein